MSLDARLSRLTSGLSARERAILVLGSLKDGTPEDPAWRRTMPQDQTHEFNRLIGVMNVANRELSMIVGYLAQKAGELGVREAWLVSLVLWQEHLDEIRRAVRLSLAEPITPSEYRAREQRLWSEWVSVQELAEMLAGDHNGWQESDDHENEDGELEVGDEAWDRVVAEKEREVQALVAAGKLPGRGKGRRLKVQFGAFNDLVWHKAGIVPEDYLSYRVRPDSEAEQVDAERRALGRLQGVLDWRPYDADSDADLPQMPTRLMQTLRETMAVMLISTWVQLRTVEVVVDELASNFGGADPLKPRIREEIDDAKAEMLSIQEHLQYLSMEVVLREPLEEELAVMREWVNERASGW